MGKNIGSVFTVHPQMMKRFKAKGHFSIFVFELNDLEKRKPKERFKFLPIARFPSTTFDCSVQLEIDRPASDPLMALNKLKIKEIKSKAIVDVFILNDSVKSVTLRVVFENPGETLTPDFIKKSEQEVVSCFKPKLFGRYCDSKCNIPKNWASLLNANFQLFTPICNYKILQNNIILFEKCEKCYASPSKECQPIELCSDNFRVLLMLMRCLSYGLKTFGDSLIVLNKRKSLFL
jgi:hypothetical protein